MRDLFVKRKRIIGKTSSMPRKVITNITGNSKRHRHKISQRIRRQRNREMAEGCQTDDERNQLQGNREGETESKSVMKFFTKCIFCSVRDSAHSTLRFHRFPRDPKMSDKWAAVCGKKFIFSTPYSVRYNKYRVCSAHFSKEDYLGSKATSLSPDAVPKPITNVNCIDIKVDTLKKCLQEKIGCKVAPIPESIVKITSSAYRHYSEQPSLVFVDSYDCIPRGIKLNVTPGIKKEPTENSESVYVVQEIDCEETSNHDGLESASGDLPEGLQSTPSNGTVWPEPAANSNPAKVEDQEIPSIESTYIKKELDCEETSASCVLGFTTRDLPNVSEQIEPSPINCEMDSNPSSSTPTPVQHQKANQKNERMEASETGPVRVASSTTPQLGSFKRKRSLEDRLDEALEILKSSSVKNDELHVFGNLVAKKLERFDDLTRSRIQSAIMDIFVNADKGFYKQTCDLSSSNSTELCTPTHNALLYKTLQSPAARFQHSLANTSSVSSPFPSVPEISFSTPSRICHLSGILEPYMSEGMSGANI